MIFHCRNDMSNKMPWLLCTFPGKIQKFKIKWKNCAFVALNKPSSMLTTACWSVCCFKPFKSRNRDSCACSVARICFKLSNFCSCRWYCAMRFFSRSSLDRTVCLCILNCWLCRLEMADNSSTDKWLNPLFTLLSTCQGKDDKGKNQQQNTPTKHTT